MTTLSGKAVLLVIGGGIAACESLELIRQLSQHDRHKQPSQVHRQRQPTIPRRLTPSKTDVAG